ncbi:MAG: hypothetical protein C9356_15035 [Oleiphilus sp.]|nr:MAG: hypothetical protein C9356_15035 [Oleiphilus sp.]
MSVLFGLMHSAGLSEEKFCCDSQLTITEMSKLDAALGVLEGCHRVFFEEARQRKWNVGTYDERMSMLREYIAFLVELPFTIAKDLEVLYDAQELAEFTSFDALWDQVDASNGYEEFWEAHKPYYKPFYEAVFSQIQRAQAQHNNLA